MYEKYNEGFLYIVVFDKTKGEKRVKHTDFFYKFNHVINRITIIFQFEKKYVV